MKRQTLIFDADDTLWENNIYFEEAFEQFFSYLAHSSMTLAEVRCVLDEIEMANARINGYGSRNYGGNLVACYRHLAERDISDRGSGGPFANSPTPFWSGQYNSSTALRKP